MNSDLVEQLGAYRSVLEDAIEEAGPVEDVTINSEAGRLSRAQDRDEPVVLSLTDREPRRRSRLAIVGLVAAAALLFGGIVLATDRDQRGDLVTDDRQVAESPAASQAPSGADLPAEPIGTGPVSAEPSSTTPADVAVSTSVDVPGRSTADSAEQRQLEEAAFFRLNLLNQSAQGHLSLSDYIRIRDEACLGAVNEPEELVEMSRRWGLGGLIGDDSSARERGESIARAIWITARNVCPEVFDDQDFSHGPPFDPGRGFGQTDSANEPPSGAQVSFVDVSVLDDPEWRWFGEQMTMFATTASSPEETVDHFRGAFSNSWTVNEVLGPVEDMSGNSPLWSIDVSGNGFTGVVEVSFGGGETFVLIAVIDGSYPLAPVVLDASPALD